MMTLKDAYRQWSAAPRNVAMVQKYSTAVHKVLIYRYGDIHLSEFTENYSRKIFRESDAPQEFKTQAASVLIYLLQWGGDHGHCKRPSFDRSIALPEDTDNKPKTENDMAELKTGGRPARRVAQIDKDTLKVVKIWPRISLILSSLGIRNVDRAIQRRGLAGGFFWCDEADVATFQPGVRAADGKKEVQAPAAQDAVPDKNDFARYESPATDAPESTHEEGFISMETTPGTVENVVSIPDSLMECSDDQLFAALELRGWRGKLGKYVERTVG